MECFEKTCFLDQKSEIGKCEPIRADPGRSGPGTMNRLKEIKKRRKTKGRIMRRGNIVTDAKSA